MLSPHHLTATVGQGGSTIPALCKLEDAGPGIGGGGSVATSTDGAAIAGLQHLANFRHLATEIGYSGIRCSELLLSHPCGHSWGEASRRDEWRCCHPW